MTIITMN